MSSKTAVLLAVIAAVVVVIPEAVGTGSAGCSTDSCLKTAYLSEDEVDPVPDTGVSMAGALRTKLSQWSVSNREDRGGQYFLSV